MQEVNKSDWKIYRQRLPEWQERFMEKLINEYTVHMQGEGLASEKFWWLEERIYKDKKLPGVIIRVRRSTFLKDLCDLIVTEAITSPKDLEGFSKPTIDAIKWYMKIWSDEDPVAARFLEMLRKRYPDEKE